MTTLVNQNVMGWSLTIGLTVFFYYKMYGLAKYHSDKYHIISGFYAALLPEAYQTALNAGLDQYVKTQDVGDALKAIRENMAKQTEAAKNDASKNSNSAG